MRLYIGADLGTSALKLLLVDQSGKVINTVSKAYDLSFPHPGWSEQEPEDWWRAFVDGVKELCQEVDTDLIKGIGVAGQMHGLVILDEQDRVIRPAILWNDGRTTDQTEYLNNVIGRDTLARETANMAFAGFTAPKILWLKQHEPQHFAAISKIMLPKDFINYRLTGVHSCDYSDAAGMLLLDVQNKCWSQKMLDICEVDQANMPKLFESYEVIGTLTAKVAALLGLPEQVTVVAGAGDNAAAAIGTGTVTDGKCNISLGTSGTVFVPYDRFAALPNNAIHNFCHATGGYHVMGCILSAASCNKWFCEEILKTSDYKTEESAIREDMLGRNSIFFLPYLMGERSPINDTDARGCFIGLRLDTKRYEMLLAVLEGVAFAIRDNFEIVKQSGISVSASTLCGGGAKSLLWRHIIANVLNIPVSVPTAEEGPGMGAAMLAMVGCGEYPNVSACADACVTVGAPTLPDPDIVARYNEQYARFQLLYPALRDTFKNIK